MIWALAYYGMTLGSPASATIGMRAMDIEMRTWYGAPAYFVLGAVHAVVFWITVSMLTPFILLVGFFNERRRSCTTSWSAPSSSTTRRAPPRCGPRAGRLMQQRVSAPLTRADFRATVSDSAGRALQTEAVTQHSRDTPQFYLTAPSPCPIWPGQEERKVFTHLVGERAPGLNDLLTHGGFRRSQSIAYRPACEACRACVSVRVIAEDFRPSRSMRRVAERNADIVGEMRAPVPTSEQYSVFRAYLDSRHRDGGMADMTVLDYAMMVEDSHVETRLVEYRRRGPDTVDQRPRRRRAARRGADRRARATACRWSIRSSIRRRRPLARHVHDPRPYRARQRMGLPYVYLGYWVRGSRKMDYKGRFLPQERLAPDGWMRVAV